MLTLVVIGALVGAACSDEPSASMAVGPRAVAAITASSGARAGLPALSSNAIKYRDSEKKPATGRSGSASLSARALYGRDGRTTLEVTTGSFDGAAAAPGNIDKLQIKLLEQNKLGRALWTQNHTGLAAGGVWSASIPAVAPGMTLQVLANVSGVDGRVDNVLVRERIKKLPDLQIVRVDAPSEALPGVPVTVVGVVREGNRDVGARASCVLYVDKVESDRANGIWVDASGTVSCAFSPRFTVGDHELRVAVEGVQPGDWDASNNTGTAMIKVAAPAPEPQPTPVPTVLSHRTRVENFKLVSWKQLTTTQDYQYGTGQATFQQLYYDSTDVRVDQRLVGVAATPWLPDGAELFPLRRLEVTHASGTLNAAFTYTDVPATRTSGWVEPGDHEAQLSCADGYADGSLGRVLVQTCAVRRKLYANGRSAGDPLADDQWRVQLQIALSRMAGEVTYVGSGYKRAHFVDIEGEVSCAGAGPDGNDYCYYNNWSDTQKSGSGWVPGASMPVLGSTYAVNYAVTGANGTVWTGRADVAIDQPYRPLPLPNGTLDVFESQLCVSNATTEEQWADGAGVRGTTSYCLKSKQTASGASGNANVGPAPWPLR